MKIKFVNDNYFIVYLNKFYYTFDKNTIESCLSKILKRIKKIYNIEVYSTFNIECFINDNYGVIMVIEREYDAFNIYSKKADLNIKFYDNSLFLYEIDDYFLKSKIDDACIYIYKNKFYLDTKNSDITSIIEYIKNVIFGDDALKVIRSKG